MHGLLFIFMSSLWDKLKTWLSVDNQKKIEYLKAQKDIITTLTPEKLQNYNYIERRTSIFAELKSYVKIGIIVFFSVVAPSELVSILTKIFTGGL